MMNSYDKLRLGSVIDITKDDLKKEEITSTISPKGIMWVLDKFVETLDELEKVEKELRQLKYS